MALLTVILLAVVSLAGCEASGPETSQVGKPGPGETNQDSKPGPGETSQTNNPGPGQARRPGLAVTARRLRQAYNTFARDNCLQFRDFVRRIKRKLRQPKKLQLGTELGKVRSDSLIRYVSPLQDSWVNLSA